MLSGLLDGMHVSSLAVAVVAVVGASGCCGTVSGMTRVGVVDGSEPLGMALSGVLITCRGAWQSIGRTGRGWREGKKGEL